MTFRTFRGLRVARSLVRLPVIHNGLFSICESCGARLGWLSELRGEIQLRRSNAPRRSLPSQTTRTPRSPHDHPPSRDSPPPWASRAPYCSAHLTSVTVPLTDTVVY